MSQFVTALSGAGTAMAVSLTVIARALPARTRGRHRPVPRTVTLEELLGPPTPYTTPAFTDVPSRGVVTQGFGFCVPCGKDTAGVLASDGWWCGECLTAAAGGAS